MFTLVALLFLGFHFGGASLGSEPNPPTFPPNIYVFSPGMDSQAQYVVDQVFKENGGQQPNLNGHWSSARYAFLFKPGTYNVNVNVGFYTSVIGIGESPLDVTIKNVVATDGSANPHTGALDNFWRSCEGVQTSSQMVWATSQASPLRRMKINGNLTLSDKGYSSGGYIADIDVTNTVNPGSQQQYYARNCRVRAFGHTNWNSVFNGVIGAPSSHCGGPNPITNVPTTPVIAEKPYIYIGGDNLFYIKVPPLKFNSSGSTTDYTAGQSISFSNVYVATEKDSAATINAKLASGLHLVLCGGNYNLSEPITIVKSNTIVVGIGYPVLQPTNGNVVFQIADGLVGVRISTILLQAGKIKSPTLMRFGSAKTPGSPKQPNFLYDLFARVGGPNDPQKYQVSSDLMVQVNTGNTVIDGAWLWRADHGVAGETVNGQNPVNTGLEFNGDYGMTYGLAVEHCLNDLVVWNGNYGQTFFFQSELPYDVTEENFGAPGYASFRVSSQVSNFKGFGMGTYCFFRDHPVTARNAMLTPTGKGIKFTNSMTCFLTGQGGIANVIDGIGGGLTKYGQRYVCSFPAN